MFNPDVFISYSREDRAKARTFAEAMEAEGLRVWWDDAIHSGQTFDTLIEQELRAADAVVVLWSPRSVTSRWVRSEASIADRGNTLVPVVIEPCDRPIMFELTHTVDLSHWDGDRNDPIWKVFLKDLARLVEFEELARPEPSARSQPEAPSRESRAVPLPPVATPRAEPVFAAPPPPPPMPDPEEEYEATQFISSTDRDALLGTDRHCLETYDGDRLETRFIIQPLGMTIGRAAPADIIISDPMISRRHCKLEFADGGVRVVDLSSTNGTFVDGERVNGTAPLPVGAKLEVGRREFTYRVRDKAEV